MTGSFVPPVQSIFLRAARFMDCLQCQPNVGTLAERDSWVRSLNGSLQLAITPVGWLTRHFIGDDGNLRRANGLVSRVENQATRRGLIIADLQDGLATNAARFEKNASVYILKKRNVYEDPPSTLMEALIESLSGRPRKFLGTVVEVREEQDFEMARRLVDRLFHSKVPSHQTLVLISDRAFQLHLHRLERQISLMERVAKTREIPDEVAVSRRFQDAQPALLDYLRRTLVELNGKEEVPWTSCEREITSRLIRRHLEREGIDSSTAIGEKRRRFAAVSFEMPAYSAFQLLCLLIQIGKGENVSDDLVADLRRAQDGRIVGLETALTAGVRWADYLRASEWIGNIDVIHANFDVALELAKREHPDANVEIVELQVRAAVARLGKATGHSRWEYDKAIERLITLESDPHAGRVIEFKPSKK